MDVPRPSRSRAVRCGGLVLAVTLAATAAAAPAGPLELPGDPAPPALAALGALDRARTLAVARDGALAAAAFPHADKPKFNLVQIAAAKGPFGEVELRGEVMSLLFAADRRSLFALVHRVGRKSRVVEAYLAHIDLDTLRTSRSVTLPETSRDLELWLAGSAILVACRDEVRTVLLPDVRSGPLFWIVGDNLSLSILRGDDLLVGQEARLLRVNLSDPQGRDRLPIRESVPSPGPVVDLASSPEGDRALARLEDGRTLIVRLEDLRLEPRGSAEAIAWLGVPEAPEPAASRSGPADSPERPPEPAARPAPPAAPPPAVRAADEAAPGAGPAAQAPPGRMPDEPDRERPEGAASASPSPPNEGVPAEPVPATPDDAPEPAEPRPPVVAPVVIDDRTTGELAGTVTGPAAADVVAVVLLGPDNVLREAQRVTPLPDGRWLARELEPGRYRVLLDAGGGTVVTTRPAFRSAEVEAGKRVTVPPLEAVRILGR